MTTATKGADLDRRMYALGPKALADEAASLLWDDGRRSLYAGDAAGCDAACTGVVLRRTLYSLVELHAPLLGSSVPGVPLLQHIFCRGL